MQDLLIQSLIASVVLTALINVLPRIFPKQAKNVEKKLHDRIEEAFKEDDMRRESGNKPRIRVFFPWKVMLVISIALTILLNFIGLFVVR